MAFHFYKKMGFWISCIGILLIIFLVYRMHLTKVEPFNAKREQLSKIYSLLDSIYWKDKDTSLLLSQKGINIAKEIGDSNFLAQFLYFKTLRYFNLGCYDSMLNSVANTLKLAQRSNNEIVIARTKNLLANYYDEKDNYYLSLNYYYDALEIFEKYNDLKNVAVVNNGFGIVYAKLNDSKQAISYFSKAANYFKKQGKLHEVALINQNIGNCYAKEKNYNDAITFHKNAQSVLRKENDSIHIISGFINLGVIYGNSGEYDDAFSYLNLARIYSEHIKNQNKLGLIFQNIGDLYFKTGKLSLAKENLNQSLSIFSKNGIKKGKSEVLLSLSEIAYKEKNIVLSYEYYKNHISLRDSILSGETQKKIAELQGDYKYKKKEYEVELINKKYEIKKKQNTILIISIISSSIILLLFAGLIGLLSKNLKNQQRLTKLENIRHQAEIEAQNKELITSSLQLISKNEILSKISLLTEDINKIDSTVNLDTELKRILQQNFNLDKDWENFKEMFEKVYLNFFATIKSICPQLTENELRICAYIKINLQNKEIAKILNINHESVIKSRYRIRKKLKLDSSENLEEFIRRIS